MYEKLVRSVQYNRNFFIIKYANLCFVLVSPYYKGESSFRFPSVSKFWNELHCGLQVFNLRDIKIRTLSMFVSKVTRHSRSHITYKDVPQTCTSLCSLRKFSPILFLAITSKGVWESNGRLSFRVSYPLSHNDVSFRVHYITPNSEKHFVF